MKIYFKRLTSFVMLIVFLVSCNVFPGIFNIPAEASWTEYTAWSGWSAWQDSAVSETDLRDVETQQVIVSTNYRTNYHYYRWANSSGTAGSHTQSATYNVWEEVTLDAPLTQSGTSGGYRWYYNGTNYRTMWKCSDWSEQVFDSYNYKTQYRYRTRSLIYYYTVSYNANGGSGAPSNQTKTGGTALALSSTVPTKTYTITYNANGGNVSTASKNVSCTFNNWKATNGTTYSKGGSYTTDADTTMTAQWTNPTAGTLATPTRTGYTFKGWYTAASGGSQITSSSTISANTTIYAQWTANTYSVKYNGNGNTSGTMSNSSHTYDTAKNLTANAFVKTGYTFAGWYTNADGTGTSYSNSASVKNLSSTNGTVINLYAKWTANTYTVKYDGNGSTAGSMSNSTFTYDKAANLTSNAYSKTYYAFSGWNTKADGSGTKYADAASVKNLSSASGGTVTLYAQWTRNEYIVSYDANGGTDAPANQSKYQGSDLTLTSSVPQKTYTITYNLNTSSGTASTPTGVPATQTVNSKFSKWNTVADSSGVSYSSGSVYKENAALKLYAIWSGAQQVTLPTPTRNGYTFNGWYCTYTSVDSALDVTPNTASGNISSPTNIYGNVTLKAQWTAKSYTITFNSSGGMCGTASKSVTFDSTYGTLPVPTRAGYTFAGWYTNATAGTKITESSKVSTASNATLYARWNAKTVTAISVDESKTKTTYYVGDVFDKSNVEITLTYEDGEKQNIKTGFICTEPVLNKVSQKRVTVTYGELTAYFTVNVVYAPLSSISIVNLPNKTDYKVDDELVSDGLKIKVSYTNGYTRDVTSGFNLSYDFSSSGTKNVTVSFTEGEITKATTFSVKVTENAAIYSDVIAGYSGEIISVPVYIKNNSGFMGFGIEVSYDDKAMTPVSVTASSLLSGAFDTSITTSTDNTFKIFWSGSENVSSNGLLFTMNFEVKNNSFGSYKIFLDYIPDDTFDESWESVKLVCSDITLNISDKDGNVTKIYSDNFNAKTGSTFIMPIKIRNNTDSSSSVVTVKYDDSIFKPISIDNGMAVVSGSNLYSASGELNVSFANIPVSSNEYILCTVEFEVLFVDIGDYVIELSNSRQIKCVNSTVKVTEGPAKIYPGEFNFNSGVVTVPICIAGNNGFMGFKLNFDFDSAVLSPVSATRGTIISSGMMEDNIASANNSSFSVVWAGNDDIVADGEILILTFNVTNTAIEETYITVSYVAEDTYNSNWQDVEFNCNTIELPISKKFTVSYSANGGSGAPASQTKTYGTALTLSSTKPTRTGYTFTGWNTEADGSGTAYASGASYTANADVTLYAQWKLDTYTISYTLNGGSVSTANPTSYNVTTAAFTLNNPTRTGYTFAGWTGTGLNAVTKTVTVAKGSTGNRTYTANWTANTNTKYVVNHYQMNVNGSGYTLKETENKTGTTASSVTIANLKKTYTGFTFEGGKGATAATATKPSTLDTTTTVFADGTRVINLYYSRNRYALTLNKGTGISAVTGAGTYYYGQSVTVDATVATGYTWSKWSDGNTTKNVTITMPANALTLTASATLNTYTISYTLNGGTVSTANPTSYNVTTSAFTLNNPNRTGYTFAGWTGTGLSAATKTVTVAKGSTGERAYTANWTANAYTVTFDANGGTTSTASKNVTYDSTYGTLPTPTRTGYTFNGWYTEKSGGNKITADTKVSITANQTLYAHWTANTYTVAFNANNGSGTMSNLAMTYGVSKALTGNAFTRTGYTFNGWNTKADGSGTAYADKASVNNLTATNGGTVTLYAQWTEIVVTKVEIKSNPTKMNYYLGESLDTNGLTLTVSYSDGSTKTVTDGFVCAPVLLETEGKQTVIVSYGGKSTSFEITVVKKQVSETDAQFVVSTAVISSKTKTVDVTVSVKNNPGIIAAKLNLSYDSSKLKLTKVTNGAVMGSSLFDPGNDLTAVPYFVCWNDMDGDHTDDGVMVTFTFEVVDGIESGVIPVTLTYDAGSTFNSDLENVEFTTVDGSVEISARTPGDSNGDGEIDLKDVVMIRRLVSGGWNVTIDESNADVNQDGFVDLKDVVVLRRYLSGGWDVTLK